MSTHDRVAYHSPNRIILFIIIFVVIVLCLPWQSCLSLRAEIGFVTFTHIGGRQFDQVYCIPFEVTIWSANLLQEALYADRRLVAKGTNHKNTFP
jgi:hypothetical protein